jgi:hypothetical protein
MKRKILLVEPNYKNKYPPIGLMKISTYHKKLGDSVEFFKGDLRDLVAGQLTQRCIISLRRVDKKTQWTNLAQDIHQFIKSRKSPNLINVIKSRSRYSMMLEQRLFKFANIYRTKDHQSYPKWDRVYITTLFTFYWKITVETIEFAKSFVRKKSDLHVGGVLASLLHKELEAATGIKPHNGLLDIPGVLDPLSKRAQKLIIDNLPLDYSILDEIDYAYPTGSAYFTFMTKGCTRKCAFCSVPILEPTYKPKIETKDKFFEVKELYGEQQNLLLMDNNVLASPNFAEIIQEIKDMGFYKGATFVEPNQFDIVIKNLNAGINDKAYIRKAYALIKGIERRLKGNTRINFNDCLEKYRLLDYSTVTKKSLLQSHKILKPIFEKHRVKTPKPRYVDFNQGTDARYVTDELMRLMSEIPIRPLRIAFDYWGIRDKYENAVRLAAKYLIKELSNYILYNFKDTPDELYKRLEINVRFNEELGMKIYSFPMKYIPLFGEDAKDRTYIGAKWNKKFIRAIQTILNATKGIVAPGRKFFNVAFGQSIEEFREILYMPEPYILFRSYFEELGLTQQWRILFYSLDESEKSEILPLIESNNFSAANHLENPKLRALLSHYLIVRKSPDQRIKNSTIQKIKKDFNKLIKDDRFIELTLTYDFEATRAPRRLQVAI